MVEIFAEGTYKDLSTGTVYSFKCISNPSNVIKQRIANQVVNTIVDNDYYHYLLTDIVTKFMVVRELTDVDLSSLAEEEYSLDSVEYFIINSTIYDAVSEIVGFKVIDDIKKAIDLGIEYKTGVHINPISESFSKLISGINNVVNSVSPEEIKEFVARVNNIEGEITADKIVASYANSPEIERLHKETNDKWDKRNEAVVKLLDEMK